MLLQAQPSYALVILGHMPDHICLHHRRTTMKFDHARMHCHRYAAGIVAAATICAAGVAAAQQQPTAAPAPQAQPAQSNLTPPPPPSWQQGRPDTMKNSTLAPNPPGLTAKSASEMKLDQIKLPPGFKMELWAEGLP